MNKMYGNEGPQLDNPPRPDRAYLGALEELANVAEHQASRLESMLARYYGHKTEAMERDANVKEVPSGYAGHMARIDRALGLITSRIGDLEDIV